MNFLEFYENFQYIYQDDISEKDADIAYKMAKTHGISILSDKDLYLIMKNKSDVVGSLWTAVNYEEFSFDIVVNEKYNGQGIGKKLADLAIEWYNSDKEAYGDDTVLRADVINPVMKHILLNKNFKVESEVIGHVMMVYDK